jgi:hypothetical protein
MTPPTINKEERKVTIVKAAIKVNGKIYEGYRHGNIMQDFWEDNPKTKIEFEDQGFLTSEGEFVSRTEAANIAFEAGQIPNGINSLDSYQVFPNNL